MGHQWSQSPQEDECLLFSPAWVLEEQCSHLLLPEINPGGRITPLWC